MNEHGAVVIVSSIAGFHPRSPLAGYGVTKTALFGLTRALSHELGQAKNIRVNCVAPGLIRTDFSRLLWENESLANEMLKDCALKRIGEVIMTTRLSSPFLRSFIPSENQNISLSFLLS